MSSKKFWMPLMVLLMIALGSASCGPSQNTKDRRVVEQQQEQYGISQPIPVYDFSVERDLVIKLYNLRNEKVATHSVWRSDYGTIEGDCPSIGFGIPYDTSLTNPWTPYYYSSGSVAVGQPEPNGIFASTNTAATWVMCVSPAGLIEPHYIEARVTVYPYPVEIDYSVDRPRPRRIGESSVNIGK